jgi:hypothetical protein
MIETIRAANDHPVALKDRRALYESIPPRQVACEIGVANGYNAEAIYQVCNPRELHLIDLWANRQDVPRWADITDVKHRQALAQCQKRFADSIREGRVFLHQGRSVPILQSFSVHYFDFAYVDGDHTYQGTLNDLRQCARVVHPGGFIAGHDYVSAATSKWAASGQYGVVEAVRDFTAKSDWKLIAVTQEKFPSFLLAIRGQ